MRLKEESYFHCNSEQNKDFGKYQEVLSAVMQALLLYSEERAKSKGNLRLSMSWSEDMDHDQMNKIPNPRRWNESFCVEGCIIKGGSEQSSWWPALKWDSYGSFTTGLYCLTTDCPWGFSGLFPMRGGLRTNPEIIGLTVVLGTSWVSLLETFPKFQV